MGFEEEASRTNEAAETDFITDEEREQFFKPPGDYGAEAPFCAGRILAGRFEIVRFLARGGMGEVYEARDRVLQGTPIALKTILPQSARDGEARVRLEQEVMLARAIVHPNICPIYDLFECEAGEGCTSFLTMKLLRGETLARRLAKGQIAAEEAECVSRQICAALRAAHRAGVVHRDLKPGNVMVDGHGATARAVVTDFGIARDFEETVTAGTRAHVLGTPGYLAPELFQSQASSPASDLFALGVVLHQIWTGRKPAKAARGDVKWKSVPKFWRELSEACLSDQPEARTREFERAVRHLRLDFDGQAGKTELIERRALLGFGAAAACALVGRVLWDSDGVDNLLHPLPKKRFVALVSFSPMAEPGMEPLVAGALRAIEAELSRAEAFDQNLFVTGPGNGANTDKGAALRAARNASGANLVLAANGATLSGEFRLLLQVMDAASGAVLRTRQVVGTATELAAEAVGAAAEILGVRLPKGSSERTAPATKSEAAYKAYQAAETLMKQPNDTGLEKALDSYRAAVEQDPQFAEAYAALGVAYCRLFWLKRDAAALELARRNAETGLHFDRDSVSGHAALSQIYDVTGKKDKALEEIRKALAIDPTNARTLLWEAQIYRHMNQWAEAEAIYHRILEQRPNYWPAYNDLGFILTKQGRYRQALQAFNEAMTAAPHSAAAPSNAGDLYFRLGDYARASQNFKKSLELGPNGWAYANLAKAMRAQGKSAEALGLIMKALDQNPSSDEIWMDLGECYESMAGKEKEAREAYSRAKQEVQRVLEVDGADRGALIRLAFYQVKTRSGDDWRQTIAKAEAIGPLDLETRTTKARIYENMGDRAQALETLKQCFGDGLTTYELALASDLQRLRKDPAYLAIAEASTRQR